MTKYPSNDAFINEVLKSKHRGLAGTKRLAGVAVKSRSVFMNIIKNNKRGE
jgi:hypothetical protein